MLNLEISKVTTRWTQRAEPTPGLGCCHSNWEKHCIFRKALKGNIFSELQFSACFVERGASKKVSDAIVGKHEQSTFCMTQGKLFKGTCSFRSSQFLRLSLRRGGLKLVAALILSEADYRSEAINRQTVPLTWPLSH